MKKTYIKPQSDVIISAPCGICAASGEYKSWHVDHNGDHAADIEQSADFGKIIYDNKSLEESEDDPFNDNNW